jgi:hypothetical protein
MKLWKLEKEFKRSVVQVIEGRERSGVLENPGNYCNDFLGKKKCGTSH